MRVLLAETNWNAMTAGAGLCEAGLLVTRVNNGTELLEFAKFGEQSAIVFDLDVPDMDGHKLLSDLRERHPLMPIYVLSQSEEWDARSRAYALGADVVMTGKVDPDYLAAQIKAAVRRTSGYSSALLQVGPMVLDTDLNRASIDGATLHLTRKEYEILEMLVLNRERLVTREAFMAHLYAWDDEPDARIINVYLSRIRQQIEVCGGDANMLETVWGLGYRISAQARPQGVAA
ncbi:response regulator transcription factor [Celeribacter sp.]|uniref:response regulator transcription factor n=1 Tax=Celeribacter sp. TaxID=1890673 RepID=UPI003A8D2198